MDVLVLIDKLDDLVHNAKAVPLTDQVRIDREEIYDILDQMRATIPEEIKQARWIVKERQEMLAEAKRETDRLLGEAREQAVREASQTEIVKIAERQAQDIVDDSRRQARETRLEMEDWADGILSTLEVNLDKFLGAVKRGRERLHERSQEHVVAGVAAASEPISATMTSIDDQPFCRRAWRKDAVTSSGVPPRPPSSRSLAKAPSRAPRRPRSRAR
jgi:F0F1-type ATP synthase membrane subunit b/b'